MRSRLFWPLVLIALGVLFLLDNLGLLPGTAWGYLWPLLLILFGVSLLLGRAGRAEPVEDSLELDGATSARINLKHGAGVLEVRAGATPGRLYDGVFGGGVEKRFDRQADHLEVTVQGRQQDWMPWDWMGGSRRLDWSVRLNPAVRLVMIVESGASDSRLDLSGLRVADFTLRTGASATQLTLPAHAGWVQARVSSGAASVDITIPSGVAARIRGRVSVGSLDVDRARFPRRDDAYESPDFGAAADRVELEIDGGVGSVTIR